MSFGAPSPPDPTATSNTQQQYNTQAATDQNKLNSYNQSNPYGSQTYAADPNSPSGYTLNTSFSAPQQQLYNTTTGTQAIAGQTGQNLLKNTAGMYSQAPDLSAATGETAKLLNSWNAQYNAPIFAQQQSNLDAQLRNQGLQQGGANNEAYNNAQNLLARNQGDVTNQYLTQNEGQAYAQALQNYQLPLQTAGTLAGMGSPTNPTFGSTPTAQIQPPNYSGQVQQNYQNQNQNYENTMSGLFGVGTGLAGGWAKAGFPGMSAIGGMFA